MNTTTVTARPAARAGGRANTRLWAAQIVLAAVFAFAAVPKLTGVDTAVTMFGQIGAGQWLRYLVGTAELAGAAGLLIPPLAGSPRPGWPPTWPAHPSSTPSCCTAGLSR